MTLEEYVLVIVAPKDTMDFGLKSYFRWSILAKFNCFAVSFSLETGSSPCGMDLWSISLQTTEPFIELPLTFHGRLEVCHRVSGYFSRVTLINL